MKLGPGEPLIKRMRYPHMLREDRAIWDKFVDQATYPIERVWYDVHIGPGIPVGEDEPAWLQRSALHLGQLRIDVIALVHETLWLIELKPDADDMALGQLLCYLFHFTRDYGSSRPVIPVCVTDLANPNVVEVFDLLGIVCLEVGPVEAILPE